MKLKHLESLLEDVEPFREPNVMLEQYPTGAHLAACVIFTAHARGDIEGCSVVDLGVGGGQGGTYNPGVYTPTVQSTLKSTVHKRLWQKMAHQTPHISTGGAALFLLPSMLSHQPHTLN